MKNSVILALVFVGMSLTGAAQPDLSYYLPEGVSYDPSIPVPKSVIGHEVGEWHVTHDRLVQYMYAIAEASDRVNIEVMGYTHEGRPLVLLTISSPENLKNIESIRQQHIKLCDPSQSDGLDIKNMPAVFYLGCSIHGNEASGSNASLLMAYYLAAARGEEIEKALKKVVILLDPSFNPDGMQRFSSWVNSRRSRSIATDPNDMEHNEPWPNGRTNHYWFDLNRDWLVAQHPESQARAKKFHQWKPNVLTDHHEMGTNSTFFFMPGVPSRMHPLTPVKNLEINRKIAAYHAKALDAIGSLYFTQEGYDDFYYGKGSTFPDIQGAIGILFEQGSTRGHAAESVNGVITFPFAIRNQFTTAIASVKAVNDLREELLDYQRQFYKESSALAAKDPVKAIAFGSVRDKARAFHLAEIIARMDISVYRPVSAININGKSFDASSCYIVPLNQPQYRLIKSMFEIRTKFADSLFYDISSWTLPLAAGLDYEELKSLPRLGEKVTEPAMPVGQLIGGESNYAYVFETYGYYAPRAIYRLLERNFRIKVATSIFHHPNGKEFRQGTIMIPVANQQRSKNELEFILRQIMQEDGIDVYGFQTGLDLNGSSLGSNSFLALRKPEIAVLVGSGVSAYQAGEIWHLLDYRFDIPVTMIPIDVFNRADINRYNTIIFPPGNYSGLSEATREKLKTWVQHGGVIIGLESALNWLSASGLGKFQMKKEETKEYKPRAYADIEEYNGAQRMYGAIFEAAVDLTHPLLFGYEHARIPVFKANELFMEKSKNPYANPIVYTPSPLLSGYVSKENHTRFKDTSIAGVSALGRGRVIGFTENLAFRAFWFGTNKILMNAVFYGHTINALSAR